MKMRYGDRKMDKATINWFNGKVSLTLEVSDEVAIDQDTAEAMIEMLKSALVGCGYASSSVERAFGDDTRGS